MVLKKAFIIININVVLLLIFLRWHMIQFFLMILDQKNSIYLKLFVTL